MAHAPTEREPGQGSEVSWRENQLLALVMAEAASDQQLLLSHTPCYSIPKRPLTLTTGIETSASKHHCLPWQQLRQLHCCALGWPVINTIFGAGADTSIHVHAQQVLVMSVL